MDFTDKTALVTGAANGIGRATALLLAKGGADVAITDINEAGLASLKAEIEALGRRCYAYRCDAASEDDCRDTAVRAIADLGHLDILINNAGIFRDGIMPFHEQTTEIWKRKIDINIYGVLYMTHAVLPHMYERRYGRIVNVASVAGIYGIRNMVDYSMTKGAILSFTYGLAREAAEYGVAVNAMSPGNIGSTDGDGGASLSYMNRRGEPEECAKVIAFLASDDASWVNGVNFTADGCRKKI
jgi:3-oxoacyl-[acyl-carrier protein] reductase